MKIEITERTATAILKLNDRYFYELFAQVCEHYTEEFEFKNAVDKRDVYRILTISQIYGY